MVYACLFSSQRLDILADDKNLLMVTISGADRPGISAAFARVLMEHKVELVDIEQASLQDLLGLYLLLDLGGAGDHKDSVIKDLLFEASRLDLTLNFRLYSPEGVKAVSQRNLFVLTHFGGAPGLAAISGILGEAGANIEQISTLNHHGSLAMQMTVNLAGAKTGSGALKRELWARSRELGIDLAMQKMEAFRKNKRAVFFDMDSTLIDMEVIDEMARIKGVGREVARITERAMRGDFDFEESLTQRVALLKGLELERLEEIKASIKLNPGVEEVVTTLKWLGYKLGVVTGGFDYFAEHLKQSLGLDWAFANRLEIKDGRLSGKVAGEVLDAAAKARIVNQTACDAGIVLDQVVVVGDGANDALMLGQAGLGIAFNAKPSLDPVANVNLGRGGMTNLLHLLGITEEDIKEAMSCR